MNDRIRHVEVDWLVHHHCSVCRSLECLKALSDAECCVMTVLQNDSKGGTVYLLYVLAGILLHQAEAKATWASVDWDLKQSMAERPLTESLLTPLAL